MEFANPKSMYLPRTIGLEHWESYSNGSYSALPPPYPLYPPSYLRCRSGRDDAAGASRRIESHRVDRIIQDVRYKVGTAIFACFLRCQFTIIHPLHTGTLSRATRSPHILFTPAYMIYDRFFFFLFSFFLFPERSRPVSNFREKHADRYEYKFQPTFV